MCVFCGIVRKFAAELFKQQEWMKSFYLSLCALLAGTAMFTSCLSNDDDDVIAYSDMAITQFTLGTLNRYTQSVSTTTGNDTLVKSTVTGSNYKMTIDQLSHQIYNNTELPVGTDIKHVICTVSAKNNGVVAVQSLTSDSLKWYSSNDSIDFSQPRIFRVYASDGSGYRDYTVTLNVSATTGINFGWTKAGTVELPSYPVRLVAIGDTVQLDRNSGVFTTTNTTYTIDENDGLLKSSRDNGQNWQTELLDEPDSLLPAAGRPMMMVSWDYAPADNTDYVLLVGQPRQDDVTTMRVWRKIAPHEGGGQWVFMPFDDSNSYPLPRMEQPLLACYDGTVLCVGEDGILRQSRDQGISWHINDTYALPSDIQGTPIAMTTDTSGRLWLLTSTGQLWRGFASK